MLINLSHSASPLGASLRRTSHQAHGWAETTEDSTARPLRTNGLGSHNDDEDEYDDDEDDDFDDDLDDDSLDELDDDLDDDDLDEDDLEDDFDDDDDF